MPQTELITSREAVKLFLDAGLSESTFRRKVRDNEIDAMMPEGRQRGALYPQRQVMAAIGKEKRGKKTEQITDHGQTDWVKESDLPYLLALDLEVYGIDAAVDISITHHWWRKNPTACRILFNQEDRREIWGYISIMPMQEETIFRLLRSEMQEKQITANDINSYDEGGEYICYIPSAVVRPERRKSFQRLIIDILNFWCEQHPRVKITKLYALAWSDEGYDLIKKLFFSPRHDLAEDAFELEPHRRNPSRLIKAFQECVKQKQAI